MLHISLRKNILFINSNFLTIEEMSNEHLAMQVGSAGELREARRC